jgi:hypothetical protein
VRTTRAWVDAFSHYKQAGVRDNNPPALRSATRKVPHTAGKVLCGQSSLHAAVNGLVLLAEEGDRQTVSWSRHDLDMIERYVDDPELLERARQRYMNALPTVRRWLHKVRPGKVLDSKARDAWKAVLGHNRLDCRNAREVATRAAREYAGA